MDLRPQEPQHTALVTGTSRGLGRALTAALLERGWHVVVDGRHADALAHSVPAGTDPERITLVPGDVADSWHRERLLQHVERIGRLDLLVNNASTLGPSPLPRVTDLSTEEFLRVLQVDVVAPLALMELFAPHLTRSRGRIVNVSSDAAVEAYPGWGGYGAAKAALDRLTAVLAAERPDLRVYAVDPGDMATQLHQQAYPGEDISDRPPPETVVPALLRLVEGELPSGRYRASELVPHASRERVGAGA